MAHLDRVRWHCRRGLLELDLILQQFVDKHLVHLSADEMQRFEEVLDYADNDLLDLVMNPALPARPDQNAILQLLRAP